VGERIVGFGTNQEIAQLAGPNTRTIDLGGRTLIPGLIDNHAHIIEECPIWAPELSLDGVEFRTEALEMIRERAIDLDPGEWVFTLGGWAMDQFTDDGSHFKRGELDRVAPENPVLSEGSSRRNQGHPTPDDDCRRKNCLRQQRRAGIMKRVHNAFVHKERDRPASQR
jgi:predicted amidohydrolase YtcJ